MGCPRAFRSLGDAMAEMSALVLDAIDVTRGRQPVLDHFSLKIPSGEFVALVGPSGCGKTTLLHLIAGLLPADGGTVRRHPPSSRIGMVFQSPRLLPWRSVGDNLSLAAGPNLDWPYLRELLDQMGLENIEALYPGQLSTGMQRRVALIRALSVKPELLLLDEPLVSLDAPTARRLRHLLLEFWARQRATILLVTHDLREALTLADRLIFLAPSPLRILADLPVGISRPERTLPRIDQRIADISQQHPDLQGLL